MTDTTDDIAEEISFQSFDDDCRLLGNLLNDVLQREVGHKFMEKLERIRILAQVVIPLLLVLFSLSFFLAQKLNLPSITRCMFSLGKAELMFPPRFHFLLEPVMRCSVSFSSQSSGVSFWLPRHRQREKKIWI